MAYPANTSITSSGTCVNIHNIVPTVYPSCALASLVAFVMFESLSWKLILDSNAEALYSVSEIVVVEQEDSSTSARRSRIRGFVFS